MSPNPIKPECQFSYRSLTQVGLIKATPLPSCQETNFKKFEGEASTLVYSKDGSKMAYSCNKSIIIIDTQTQKEVRKLDHGEVLALELSPKGTYVSSWQRASKKDESGATLPNVFLYSVESGLLLSSFICKDFSHWNLQFTMDESFMARSVTNEIHFYSQSKLSSNSPTFKLRHENLTTFSLSPGKSPHVAIFVPEKKGAPAKVRMYSVPNFQSPVASKSFFKADKVTLSWNDLGTNLLVLTQTDVDKTGKSYYGESNLYYLSVAGNFDCRVPLDKEGPIHDVTWSPSSKEFAVCYGFMPSKTTIFDHRSNPIHQFGENSRNFIRYSPHSQYILHAGFGNLTGAMDIYNRTTLKKLTTIDGSGSAFCEWLPDGKHFVTATLSPRLRVDNGFKVWHYTGVLVFEELLNNLYQIEIKPIQKDKFPQSKKGDLSPPPQPIKKDSVVKSTLPKGAYVPPHLRHLQSSTTATAKQTQTKNNNEIKLNEEKDALTKKVRNLQKKLNQIDSLFKQATEGIQLKPEQLNKIKTKPDIVSELQSLNEKLSTLL